MRFFADKSKNKGGVSKAPLSSQGALKPFAAAVGRRPFSNSTLDPEPTAVSSQDDSLTLPTITPTDTSRMGSDEAEKNLSQLNFPSYTITNLSYDRTYNANGSSTGELADVLGTLIRDVRNLVTEIDKRFRNARKT